MKYFDLHCDTLFSIAHEGGSLKQRKGHIDLNRAAVYDPYAQVFALFCGPKPLDSPEKAHELFQLLLCTAKQQFADCADRLLLCRTAQDFDRACREGKTAAFLAVEGAELLQNEQDFHAAVDAGVRIVTLSWNHDSVFACGAASDPRKGLTSRGRKLVSMLEQAGVIPDVSHLSERGFWDLADCTDAPILATHSNSRTVHEHVRNLTDEQVREIVRRGGLIGLNFYVPFLTGRKRSVMADVFPHIDHLLELGCESTLAIGADFDGCDRLPEGVEDITAMQAVRDELLRHGYSEQLTDALFFENAARFVRNYFK
ncbi:MAG: dipeptidase [Butyricicoccus sp.]